MEYVNFLWLKHSLNRFCNGAEGMAGPEDFVSYWQNVVRVRTSPNGVFGYKAFTMEISNLCRNYQGVLAGIIPSNVVYLTRSDTVGQAISYSRAIKTRSWFKGKGSDNLECVYDHGHISDCMKTIDRQKRVWEGFFSVMGIEPLRITYEDLLSSTEGVVNEVLGYLDIRRDDTRKIDIPMIERQRDSVSDEWRHRFLEDEEMHHIVS